MSAPNLPPRLPAEPLSLEALDRHLAGESTEADREHVERWMSAHPEQAYRIERIAGQWNAGAAADRLAERLAGFDTASDNGSRRPSRSWRSYALGVAVASASLAVIAYVVMPLSEQNSDRPIIMREHVTQRAQHATIDLPDGSRLHLAPDSRVRYTETASGARKVALSGEAYFTVTHDPAHPFTVYTGTVATEVLGTAFNIRRYAGEQTTDVAVIAGKVRTRTESNTALVLTPGAVGVFSDSTANLLPSVTAADAIAWTQGRLVFTDAPVQRMLATVGRWYGYEIRLTDSTLATRHVTFMVPADRPVQTTIRYLEDLLDVTVTIERQVLVLRPRDARIRRHEAPVPPKYEKPKDYPAPTEMGK